MAANSRKSEEDDSGEFAEFMADISQEIAQRVESLEAPPTAAPEPKKATPLQRDANLILEWENLADRMIEEMR
jgi:hypothetical protein